MSNWNCNTVIRYFSFVPKKRPYFFLWIIDLMLIVFGLFLPGFFQKKSINMTKGFSAPIIFFEFIKTPTNYLKLINN
jgi:hypothetical protein